MNNQNKHDNNEQYTSLFKWKDNTYTSWILNLASLRPVIERFGNKHDAFMFCNTEHFEELRLSTMMEF